MRWPVANKPASGMIEALTPIWERVLQRSPIGPEDNFFDLGGDAITAVRLFGEIARALGRELPAAWIYQTPTIAALAAVLDLPEMPKFPALVLLRPGAEEPPVFIAHGLGGNVLSLFHLIKDVRTEHPIYGMQARGIDGMDEPFGRVEDEALFFLEAMLKIQPHGPYFLVGYSFGGLVTLEMAQSLSERGEKVGLLAMLETYPHKRFLPFAERAGLRVRLIKHHARTLMKLPFRAALSYITNPAERMLYRARKGGESVRTAPSGPAPSSAARRMRDYGYRAYRNYRPGSYCGKIKFVKAAITFPFPDDPASYWGKLAGELQVETVPGDHHGILRTDSQELADILSRYLREAFNEK